MDFYLHDCDYTIKATSDFKNGSILTMGNVKFNIAVVHHLLLVEFTNSGVHPYMQGIGI